MGLIINERDKKVLKNIEMFRIMYGRSLWRLSGFTSRKYSEKRLKKLIDAGLIDRSRPQKGIPFVYQITQKGMWELDLDKKPPKVKEHIMDHELAIADIAALMAQKYPYCEITPERRLRQLEYKNTNQQQAAHKPDLEMKLGDKNIAIEFEKTQKKTSRFEKNIIQNFNDYDKCIWVIPRERRRIQKNLLDFKTKIGLDNDQLEIMIFEDIVAALIDENIQPESLVQKEISIFKPRLSIPISADKPKVEQEKEDSKRISGDIDQWLNIYGGGAYE